MISQLPPTTDCSETSESQFQFPSKRIWPSPLSGEKSAKCRSLEASGDATRSQSVVTQAIQLREGVDYEGQVSGKMPCCPHRARRQVCRVGNLPQSVALALVKDPEEGLTESPAMTPEKQVRLSDYRNVPLPVFLSVPLQRDLATSCIKRWSLFSHSLNLGWPYDLLWPIEEGSRSDSVPVLSLGLQKPAYLSPPPLFSSPLPTTSPTSPTLLESWCCYMNKHAGEMWEIREKRPHSVNSSNQGHPRPSSWP